jgi:hypothetical protein
MIKNVHESITKLLLDRLKKYKQERLDSQTCIAIYREIFSTLQEVIQTSSIPLGNESINLLSQMYYDSVTINANQQLDPNIFTQLASLGNIPTEELGLMATMMNGTPFAPFFVSEIKKRS